MHSPEGRAVLRPTSVLISSATLLVGWGCLRLVSELFPGSDLSPSHDLHDALIVAGVSVVMLTILYAVWRADVLEPSLLIALGVATAALFVAERISAPPVVVLILELLFPLAAGSLTWIRLRQLKKRDAVVVFILTIIFGTAVAFVVAPAVLIGHLEMSGIMTPANESHYSGIYASRTAYHYGLILTPLVIGLLWEMRRHFRRTTERHLESA